MNITHERETNDRFRKVIRLQYLVFRISIRREFTLLHNSGKLCLQYLVDQYFHVKGEKLMYQWTPIDQNKLHVERSLAWKDYNFTIIFSKISKEYEYALPRHNGINSSIQQAFALYYHYMQPEMEKYYRQLRLCVSVQFPP